MSKLHKPYQDAVEELSRLLDERDKSKENLLLEAVRESKLSYDEIMEFIKSDPNDDEWYEPGQDF